MSKKQDRIFTGLAERFSKRIYGNEKGQVRLHILQDDLSVVPDLVDSAQPLKILDAGGGLGQMSLWLASENNDVTLLEPAEDMLAGAKALFAEQDVKIPVQFCGDDIQCFDPVLKGSFDVIVSHAVLEWLADPKETLEYLLEFLKPGGWLSLMFYNQHSAVMRSLMVADFKRIREGKIAGDGNRGFTPISPLEPDEVISWLEAWGYEIKIWSGVRVFHDYMRPEARKIAQLEDVFEMERRYSQQEPWRSMARYQHLLCRKQ